MKLAKRIAAMLLTIVAIAAITVPAFADLSSNDFKLSGSKSGKLLGSNVQINFNSRVTGGAKTLVSGYKARFNGTASGSWSKGETCSISRTLSFKMTGLGSLNLSAGTSGAGGSMSISGSTASKTIETTCKSFNWAYDLTFERFNICWVTQSLSSSFTKQVSGVAYTTSINCSADKVFW